MFENPPPPEPSEPHEPNETNKPSFEGAGSDMPFGMGIEETSLPLSSHSPLENRAFETPADTVNALFDVYADGPSTPDMQQRAQALQKTGVFEWLGTPRPPVVRLFGAKRYPIPENDQLISPDKASELVNDQIREYWDTRQVIKFAGRTTDALCEDLDENSNHTLVSRTPVPEKQGLRQVGNMHILTLDGSKPLIDEIPLDDQGDTPLPPLLRADQPNGNIHLTNTAATQRYIISQSEGASGGIAVTYEAHIALRPDDVAFIRDLKEQLAAHALLLDKAAIGAGVDISKLDDFDATPIAVQQALISEANEKTSQYVQPGTAIHEQLVRSTIALNYAIRPSIANDPDLGADTTVTTGLTAIGQRIANYYALVFQESQ